MKKSLEKELGKHEHIYNPLVIYSRWLDLGMLKKDAKRLIKNYEVVYKESIKLIRNEYKENY